MLIDHAIRSLEDMQDARLKAKPCSKEWYELQALARGITFLKVMRVAGLQDIPTMFDDKRKEEKDKDLDDTKPK